MKPNKAIVITGNLVECIIKHNPPNYNIFKFAFIPNPRCITPYYIVGHRKWFFSVTATSLMKIGAAPSKFHLLTRFRL